ncbi:MAG: hypothetical protein Solumvirus5_14 [Solumvirus sp.]|uniref:Uncharacterized protein n=1 Tax=Solumvirus sp. TaxID=2487773 RepID=A0A3G5AGM9_9VIRU|nr:MAG: hypothetical protein Solumvirus5_14 [Solumvirus sp.]
MEEQDPTIEEIRALHQEALKATKISQQTIELKTIPNPNAKTMKVERYNQRARQVVTEEKEIDPLLFVGYDYRIDEVVDQVSTLKISQPIILGIRTYDFLEKACNLQAYQFDVPIIPEYIHVPAPPEIRSDIRSGVYMSNIEGESTTYGTYVSLGTRQVYKHGLFHRFSYGADDNIITYGQFTYDFGILRQVVSYIIGENNVEWSYSIILDGYGYIKRIRSQFIEIDIGPKISYIAAYFGSVDIIDSHIKQSESIAELFTFYTNEPLRLSDVVSTEKYNPRYNTSLPMIDGIAYLSSESDKLIYTFGGARVDRKFFYDSIEEDLDHLSKDITGTFKNIGYYIPIKGIQNIIIDYVIEPINPTLKTNLIKSEAVFHNDRNPESVKNDLDIIRRVLKKWPAGW